MKRISQFLLSFLVLGVIFSCARTPQRIELHPVYVIPRGTPEGPGLPLGVAEGLDTEKVKASTVRVVYGEGDSTMIGSGFFVANDKIAMISIRLLASSLTLPEPTTIGQLRRKYLDKRGPRKQISKRRRNLTRI